jgi:hypothetical protein
MDIISALAAFSPNRGGATAGMGPFLAQARTVPGHASSFAFNQAIDAP